jgi:hypothetical protein
MRTNILDPAESHGFIGHIQARAIKEGLFGIANETFFDFFHNNLFDEVLNFRLH